MEIDEADEWDVSADRAEAVDGPRPRFDRQYWLRSMAILAGRGCIILCILVAGLTGFVFGRADRPRPIEILGVRLLGVPEPTVEPALQEQVIWVGEETQWQFEAPRTVERAMLSLQARVDWYRLAGATPLMDIRVNGTPVTAECLANKPGTFTLADGRRFDYYRLITAGGKRYWSVFYSPDYTANDQATYPYQVIEGQACRYTFDVSGLVRPGKQNTITIANVGAVAQDKMGRPLGLKVRDVELSFETAGQ